MSSRDKAISFMINLRSCYGQSFFLSFFFFFFNDGTTGIGEENCASLHVSKNRDKFHVSWTWTHSVKFPAIKKVISHCAISTKKGSSRRIYSCFFTHNGIATPKTTREGQESTTKISLHLAWPPKFKNQVLFTPKAQNRFLVLGLLLRGWRPKSRSLPGRVEVIQPVVRACTTFWLTSTRITLTRVHRRTNSRANLCTIRENEHHGAHFRGVRTRVFVPPAKMCTMQIDWSWTWLLCRAQSRQSSCTCWGDHRCVFSFFASLRHKPQGCRVQSDDIAAFDTKAWLIWLQWTRIRNCTILELEEARRWFLAESIKRLTLIGAVGVGIRFEPGLR